MSWTEQRTVQDTVLTGGMRLAAFGPPAHPVVDEASTPPGTVREGESRVAASTSACLGAEAAMCRFMRNRHAHAH